MELTDLLLLIVVSTTVIVVPAIAYTKYQLRFRRRLAKIAARSIASLEEGAVARIVGRREVRSGRHGVGGVGVIGTGLARARPAVHGATGNETTWPSS